MDESGRSQIDGLLYDIQRGLHKGVGLIVMRCQGRELNRVIHGWKSRFARQGVVRKWQSYG